MLTCRAFARSLRSGSATRALAALLAVALSSGCVQANLLDWARDEVSVDGLARGAHDETWSVRLDIHDVDTLDDGIFVIPISVLRTMPPSHDGPDGVRELDVAAIGGMRWVGPKIDEKDWAEDFFQSVAPLRINWPRELDAQSLAHPDDERMRLHRKPSDPGLPPDVGTRLTCSPDRDYELEIFVFDDDGKRWVRIGRVAIGHGMQSPALRKTTVVALYPFAILLDIALFPFALIRNQARLGCCLGSIPM